MFSQKSQANLTPPRKMPSQTVCRAKMTYNSIHTIVGVGTQIDFHFFRDVFGIALAKDRDRNPTVLQIEIKNDNDMYVSKTSFTTPVQIKYGEKDPWRNILVSDGFELENIVYIKVDGHEMKMERVQAPELMNKLPSVSPQKMDKASIPKQSVVSRQIGKDSIQKSPQIIEDSPVKSIKVIANKKEEAINNKPKKSTNIWDYFGNVLGMDKKPSVSKETHLNKNKTISQQPRRGSPLEVEEITHKDYFASSTPILKADPRPLNNPSSLTEKRKEPFNLSDIENNLIARGSLSKKKLKTDKTANGMDDNRGNIENIEDCEVQTVVLGSPQNISELKSPLDPFNNDVDILKQMKKKKKIIRIIDEEEEEKCKGVSDDAESFPEEIKSEKAKKDDNGSIIELESTIEEEKSELKSPERRRESNKEIVISSSPRSPSSPKNRKDREMERNKLKRLKKVVDNRRETLNKRSAGKGMGMSQEVKENQIKKETCPICLSDITNELGKLDSCTHVFCFDCIKDWSDVTNECPYCKRRFNEIVKHAIGEKGELTKIEAVKVEFKKQVYEEEINYIEEEVDENCYECGADDNQNVLLVCDDCGFHCCHTYCCDPPLDFIPDGDWLCRFCQQNRRPRRNAPRGNRNHTVRAPQQNSYSRQTRSSSRRGQSLLERLFEIVDDQVDNETETFLETQSINSIDSTDSIDLDETTHTYRANNRSNGRRNTRLRRNNNSRNTSDRAPTRRNTRTSRIGALEEEFNSNLDDFTYSSSRSRRQTSQNQNNSRMNIESMGRNNNPMSVEDLNQFRYPLRSHGRSNY